MNEIKEFSFQYYPCMKKIMVSVETVNGEKLALMDDCESDKEIMKALERLFNRYSKHFSLDTASKCEMD